MKIYNTLTKQKQELAEKKIGLYACGPTVYDDPHIGHARSAYVFDLIVRYMRFRGKKVIFVSNITDVDDKIIEKARNLCKDNDIKRTAQEIADKYLKSYTDAMDLLGIKKPDRQPKATKSITDMIKFIEDLINREYAYVSNGNVYFDVLKFKDYGKLSGQSVEEMKEGARVSLDKNKKNPLDFALWKTSKEDEPSWPSPWGLGRPGWHIECSVMSTKFLKNDFIIHGGGLDLVFPHHENEIAQTEAAGKKSAKYWIHHGLLTINGQKMSKSLGNFITVSDFAAKYKDLDLLKLLFLSSQYRHPVDYTDEKVEAQKQSKKRIKRFLKEIDDVLKNVKLSPKSQISDKYSLNFTAAMDDDFNTPLAMSVIFKCVEDGYKILRKDNLSESDYLELYGGQIFIKDSARQLGFDFSTIVEMKDDFVLSKIVERDKARDSKDFAKADKIRDELFEKGIILKDTSEGTKWEKRG